MCFEPVYTEDDRDDGFEIVLSFAPEDMEPDWDMTPEEKADVYDKINRGVLLWFCARVEAKRAGITLGTDYLGGCCYDSIDDFIRGDYFDDMTNQALEAAKRTIDAINA